jgi:hypothetical protein
MKRVMIIPVTLLLLVIICSCATDKVSIARNHEIACKVSDSRYDYGRNKKGRYVRTGKTGIQSSLLLTSLKKSHRKNFAGIIRNSEKYGEKQYSDPVQTRQNNNDITAAISELQPYKIPFGSVGNNQLISGSKFPSEYPVAFNEPEKNLTGHVKINSFNSLSETKPQSESVPLNNSYTNESGEKIQIPSGNADKQRQAQKLPFTGGETFFLLMALMAGLVSLAILKANPKTATNISFRASMNPWKTRFLFAAAATGLAVSGFMLGGKLAGEGIHFSTLSRDILLGTFLASSALYPVRHTSVKVLKHSYLRQKTFDLVLTVSGFMLMLNAGNDQVMRTSFSNLTDLKGRVQNTIQINNSLPASHLLIYQGNDKQQQQDPQMTDQQEKKLRTKRIIFTVLVALGFIVLAFALAVAACGLACNGLTGLAYLVGIGGGLLAVGLAVWLIKAIWHPKPSKRRQTLGETKTVLT